MSTISQEKLEKMSVAERAAIEQQVRDQEEQLSNPEKLDAAGQNGIGEMKADIQKKKDLLAKDQELRATSTQKDQIAKRMKEIEAIIVPEMPTKNEMWLKSGTEESARAVRKNLNFQQKFGHLAREWQILAKRLEPDDPWAQSLETIRPN